MAVFNGTPNNDVFGGTDANDTAYGNGGDDQLSGGGGDDVLDGGTGSDTLTGGTGNDTFYVDATTDQVIENAGEGIDAVIASVSWTLGDNVENLTLSRGGTGVGNELDNLFVAGTSGSIDGRGGSDTYAFLESAWKYDAGPVKINLGTGIVYQDDEGGDYDVLTLTNVENARGSAIHGDIITGSDGRNILEGLGGDDNIIGGLGDDVIDGGAGTDQVSFKSTAGAVVVDLVNHVATSGDGRDLILNIEDVYGSAFDDLIVADASNNSFNAAGGTDTVSYFHAAAAVQVDLAAFTATGGSGTDSLHGFENVIGSAFNDSLLGTTGDNLLQGGAGNDTINGRGGIDTASYADAAAGVRLDLRLTSAQATGGSGTDTVTNIENLIGGSGADTFLGSDAANVLTGGYGADILNGFAGADTLDGGEGTDQVSYNGAAGAVRVDLAVTGGQATGGSGTDTLVSIEDARGSSYGDTLIGNDGVNLLDGRDGNDTLNSRDGNDVLTGGAGKDIFRFTSALGPHNIDTITDFSVADDSISLGKSTFKGIASGALSADAFYVGSAAHDGSDRIIYNAATGALLYDRDGNASAYVAVQFATVGANLAITAADFTVA